MTFSAWEQWEGETNGDAGVSSNHGRRSPRSGRGRAHTPIAREQGADPTWCRQEDPFLGIKDQKEEIVNYAARFLIGDVPRQRTGAVFLAVAALGIFVAG